jgi:hypothetical protein
MFIAAQGYDWVSHQAWFGQPQLSLPWLILGGIGLAIASNRSELKALTATAAQLPAAEVTPTMPDDAMVADRSLGTITPEPEPVTPPQPQPQGPQDKSISFEIKA